MAQAHVGLEDPVARYESDGLSNNKSCPCGVSDNDDRCTDPAIRSDPNRDPLRVTTYAAGETVVISFHEVIGHTGRWRIAFDDDGADQDDFDANILVDEPDPSGNAGNTGLGDLWEFEVTLPTTPCDNCTLQVLQVMNGNSVDPVPDPTGMSTYWQCADIELTAVSDTGDTAVTPTVDTGTPGTTPPTTTPPGNTPPTTDTGTASTSSTGPTAPTDSTAAGTEGPGPEEADGGCGCVSSPAASWPLGPLWLAGLRRR